MILLLTPLRHKTDKELIYHTLLLASQDLSHEMPIRILQNVRYNLGDMVDPTRDENRIRETGTCRDVPLGNHQLDK